MSLNLVFKVKDGSGSVDFPFQTPTELTYAVLLTETGEKKLELLQNAMLEWGWEEELRERYLGEIKVLMDSSLLKLSFT